MEMKKTLLLKLIYLCLFLTTIVSLNAQDTLVNQGFNRWEKSGKQPPFDWSEPQGWTSSNSLTEFISAGVKETTINQSGSAQAELRTLNVFGQDIPAILINGDFPISISDTANFPLVGGEPMTSVKNMLYGMYNFSSSTGGDSASVVVAFKKFNSSTQQAELVAIGSTNLSPTQSGLYPFTVLVNPVTFDTPDSVVVTILSSKADDFKTGGILTVDYVGFSKPTNLKEVVNTTSSKVYPSPASNKITIQNETDNFKYSILDAIGKVHATGTSANNTKQLDISTFKNGVYFIQIEAENPKILKFIKGN